jgi:hypothetical protein
VTVAADVRLRDVCLKPMLGKFVLAEGPCEEPAVILNPLRSKEIRIRKGTLGKNHERRGLEEGVRTGEFGRV